MEDSAGKITELNERQRSGMDAAKLLAEMGLDVTVYASTEADRKAGMENGNIRLSDGSIRVDLNAGADGQGVMTFALSHEFTHFVEEMSPKKFRTFTDILFEEMGKKGADVAALIEAKAQTLGKMEENKGLSENELNDLAYSEVAAEMMETALADTDVMERISVRLQQTDKSLWGKIKDFLKGLVDRLKAAYKSMKPDSSIAQLARETINSSERVLDAFADAASDAIVNYNLQGDNVSAAKPANSTVNTVESIAGAESAVDTASSAVNTTESITRSESSAAGVQKNAAQGNAEQSVKRTEYGEFVAAVSDDILKNTDPAQWSGEDKANAIIAAREALAKFGEIVVYDITDDQFGNICQVSTEQMRSGKLLPMTSSNYKAVAIGNVLMGAGKNQYSVSVYVGKTQTGENVFYNVRDIKPTQFTVAEGQKNNAREGVQLSARETSDAKSLVAQLQDNIDKLSEMDAVATVDGTEMNKSLKPVAAAMEYVNSFGASVTRKGFGEVRFSKSKIKSGLVGHGMGNAKMETFAAVPAVIQKGIQIGYSNDWKGRHKDSYVFAAPINYKGNVSYVGVIVERDNQSGMYYVHEVVDNSGNVIAFENKTEESTSDRLLTQTGRGDTVADSSTGTISQSDAEVKGILKSSRDATDTQYMELAKDPEGNRLELETMVQDAAEKAGFVYKRNTRRKHAPANAVPWQMFVRGVDAEQSNYGGYTYYATDAGAISIEEIMPRVQELAEEFYGTTLSEGEINPPDIVETAGIWDDKDFVQYLWDNYFEGIMDETGSVPAVVTDDGMIVLDEDNTRVKSGDAVEYDDSGNVIPLSERFNARADDIRYSSRQRADGKAEQLATEVEYLKKLVQIQKKGNSDYTLDRTSLKQFASQLIRENGASGSSTELAALLEDTYNYISRSTDFLWEGIEERAGKAVDWLEAHRKVQRDSYAQEVLDFMSKRHVKLSEAQLGEKPLCGRRSSHSGIVFVGAYFVPVSATPFAYRV